MKNKSEIIGNQYVISEVFVALLLAVRDREFQGELQIVFNTEYYIER